MNLIRSLLGRRQFLIAFFSSSLTLTFGRFSKAFGLIYQTSLAKASENTGSAKTKKLKGIVAYYSATGNTAQVANALYHGMESVIACDVAPIKMLNPKDMSKYNLMAIGAPNWYMREPANVKFFTHNMPRMDGKHCIIFGTHGGSPLGQYWSMSRNILKKGMTIIGWNDWYGSDFMTPHSNVPDGEWGHPDEIDLAEAEAFGRQMAEHSIRIYAGERDLIPRIPTPGKGENSLWSPRVNELGNITFASPPPNSIPEFDFTKCVYPRCTQCIENCPVRAIDFSVITTAGSIVPPASTISSPLVLKEACQHCGGLCERVCHYDAISYVGEKIKLEVNMTKCTYPKCTECIDNCPQDSIDFSVDPPIVHNWCEAAGLCWGVCPENAIEVPNMAEVQLKKGWWFRGEFSGPGMLGQMQELTMGEAGEESEAPRASHYPPRFRPLVREEDIGSRGQVMFFTEYPRVPIKKELWPYEVDEG